MSDCKHKWIGDTCCECGVNYAVWADSELNNLRAENARLQSEVDALRGPHNDEIWHLTQERDSARGTVSMWLEANGPGGWIDKLRSDLQRHKQALEKASDCLREVVHGPEQAWNSWLACRDDALRHIDEVLK